MKDIYKWIALGLAAALASYLILTALYAPDQDVSVITSPPMSGKRQTANWKTYANSTYGFEIKYPKIYILDQGVSPTYYVGEYFTSGGKNIVTIEFWPSAIYAGTNYLDAFITISVGNTGMPEEACQKAQRLGSGQSINLTEARVINNITFNGGELEGAAAGTYAKSRVYHAMINKRCYEVSLNLFQGKIDKNQSSTVKQVNEQEVFSKLEAVFNTFKLVSSAGDLGEIEITNWQAYVNQMYQYKFFYPKEAIVSQADKAAFGLSQENKQKGLTIDQLFSDYTGLICLKITDKLGYIFISASANKNFGLVTCGRTGAGYQIKDKQEQVAINDKKFTATGFEEVGPGQTLNFHNETLVVNLDDGTRIEYGALPDDQATFSDYQKIKPELLKILKTYQPI